MSNKFGFDDSELAKLFADAGAAVSKAKVSQPKSDITLDMPEPDTVSSVIKPEPTAKPDMPPKQPSVMSTSDYDSTYSTLGSEKKAASTQIPSGKTFTVVSGSLDGDSLTVSTADSQSVKVIFTNIKALILGRLESEQILAWKALGAVFVVSDKTTSLKGMLPKMAFSAPENWRNLIIMLAEKTGLNGDPGIQAVINSMGMIPRFNSKELLLEQIKGL